MQVVETDTIDQVFICLDKKLFIFNLQKGRRNEILAFYLLWSIKPMPAMNHHFQKDSRFQKTILSKKIISKISGLFFPFLTDLQIFVSFLQVVCRFVHIGQISYHIIFLVLIFNVFYIYFYLYLLRILSPFIY